MAVQHHGSRPVATPPPGSRELPTASPWESPWSEPQGTTERRMLGAPTNGSPSGWWTIGEPFMTALGGWLLGGVHPVKPGYNHIIQVKKYNLYYFFWGFNSPGYRLASITITIEDHDWPPFTLANQCHSHNGEAHPFLIHHTAYSCSSNAKVVLTNTTQLAQLNNPPTIHHSYIYSPTKINHWPAIAPINHHH